jgi:hypothetical protein
MISLNHILIHKYYPVQASIWSYLFYNDETYDKLFGFKKALRFKLKNCSGQIEFKLVT